MPRVTFGYKLTIAGFFFLLPQSVYIYILLKREYLTNGSASSTELAVKGSNLPLAANQTVLAGAAIAVFAILTNCILVVTVIVSKH